MKIITSLLLLLTTASVLADRPYKSRLIYDVVSDEVDTTISVGKCKITGNVSFGNEPLVHARISTDDHLTNTVTDSLGNYELIIDEKDSVIYFFKPRYNEIVIKGVPFDSQHHLVIHFYPFQEIRNNAVKKPVIYLYDKQERAIDLALDFHSDLTFTYPEYKNGWSVQMSENGDIIHNGKSYPYLFWEGETQHLRYNKENSMPYGTVIRTDSIISYLENVLDHFALNSTEKTDFITFWGLQLQKKKYAFVQFIYNQDYYQRIAGITTSIKPDFTLRLFMYYTLYDETPAFKYSTQNYPQLIRTGDLQLIEWGGAEIYHNQIRL